MKTLVRGLVAVCAASSVLLSLAACSNVILDDLQAIKRVDSGGFDNAVLAVDSTTVYLCAHDSVNDDLKFARSTDGGQSWPAASVVKVDSVGNVGAIPWIGISGTTITATYDDWTTYFRKVAVSTDGGSTWTRVLTNVSLGYPEMYSDGVKLFSFDGLGSSQYFQVQTSALGDGNSWSTPYNVNGSAFSTARGNQRWSQFFSSAPGTVDILYLWAGGIYFAHSANAGVTWSNARIIPSNQAADHISAAHWGSTYAMAYTEQNSSTVRFMSSTDNGTTWSVDARIADQHFTTNSGGILQVAGSANGITVMQTNAPTVAMGNVDILRSVDTGMTWSALGTQVSLVAGSPNPSPLSLISVNASTLGLALSVGFGGNNPMLCFMKSIDGGATWY